MGDFDIAVQMLLDQPFEGLPSDTVFTADWHEIYSDEEPHNSRKHPRYGNAGPLSDCDVATIPFPFFKRSLRIRQDLGDEQMIWNASIALACLIEKCPLLVAKKKVIDIGAGTGLVGLLSVLAGGSVTITDLPALVPHIADNAEKNGLADGLVVQEYTWGKEVESCHCLSCAMSDDESSNSDDLIDAQEALLRQLFSELDVDEIRRSMASSKGDFDIAVQMLLESIFDIQVARQKLHPRYLRDVDIHICSLVRKKPPDMDEDAKLVERAAAIFPKCGWLSNHD